MDKRIINHELSLNGSFNCSAFPVQAEGTVKGNRFYFRARNDSWSFSVLDENSNCAFPEAIGILGEKDAFYIKEKWVNDPYDAGMMPLDEAEKIIIECCKKYIDQLKTVPKKYQDRVIAFIDIIGFKEIVTRTADDPTFFNKIIKAISDIRHEFIVHRQSEMYKNIKNIFYDSFTSPDYMTRVTQISDCIIISKLASTPGSLIELAMDVAFAIHLLIKNGLLCRGSIAMGKVYHTDEYLIGPGYISAYLGEQSEFVPAVSLSEEIYNFGKQNGYHARNTHASKMELYYSNFVVPHIKGMYFIDYYNDLENNIDVLESPANHYGKLKEIIICGYNSAMDYKIKAKYLWMIDNFNASKIVKSGEIEPIKKQVEYAD